VLALALFRGAPTRSVGASMLGRLAG
jgi:hypothetical protein